MLVARDPLTNTFVNAFDYKHMSPEERPNGLLCPECVSMGHPAQLPSPRPPCHRSTSTLISVSAASTTTLTDAPKGPLASTPGHSSCY